MIEDFKSDVNIDVSNLGEELIKQSSLFVKWGHRWGNEVADRDRIKNKLEFLKAKVEMEIRDSTTQKLTEATVKSLVDLNSEIVEVKEEFNLANQRVNDLATIKSGMEQKKSMLENVVKLYQTGYWGELAVPDTSGIENKYAEKKITEGLTQNERLKRRIKNG